MKLYNIKSQKELRRNLRKLPVKSEMMLWRKIKNKQLGYKFRRQFGIGRYIVDFYCPRLKLVIEIDGATHGTDKEIKHDKIRQDFLENVGCVVKRYNNSEVQNNMNEVLDNILRVCNELNSK